jgi:Flp pilus assembly protein TadD
MAFKFCPECGTPVEDGARFCTGCGQTVGGRAGASALPTAGIAALVTLLLLGGGFWLYFRMVPTPTRGLKPGEGPVAGAQAPGGGAPGTGAGGAPHPQIDLPDDIKQYIAGLQKDANDKPKDVNAWQTLGRVQYRASRLDPSYVDAAQATFQHLLEIDPKNLDGLRGLGNLAYDQQDRDKAVAFYQKYLAIKPDDPEVRTDYGTMLFESGDIPGSLREFKNVVEKNPEFFQAYFNLGIVYESQGDREGAKLQLVKARDLATDDNVKARISALITAAEQGIPFAQAAEAFAAQNQGQPGAAPPMGGGAAPGAPAMGGGAPPAAAAPATTFAGSVEQVFRSNPVAGPKVARVEWPTPDHGRVLMNSFPMQAMPDVMRNSYLEKMTNGTRDAKTKFAVQGPVTIEVVDQSSGEVMATITP